MKNTILLSCILSVVISFTTATITTYLMTTEDVSGPVPSTEVAAVLEPEAVKVGGPVAEENKATIIAEYQRLLREEDISEEARALYTAEIQKLQSVGQ